MESMTEQQMREVLRSVLSDLERETERVRRTARGVLLPTTLGLGLVLGGSVSCAAAPPRKKDASVKVDMRVDAGADAVKGDAVKGDAVKGDAVKGDAAKGDGQASDQAELVDAPCPPYMCPDS